MSKSRDIADSAATINFIDTVTSNVQTQLNTLDTALDNISVTSGTLTKTFTSGETASISLTSSVLAPVVSVTKEVPQSGVTNNNWDVNSTTENYTRLDSAYATTLDFASEIPTTPSISYTGNSFNYNSQDSNGREVQFKDDGTKMYVFGGTNARVYQYSLSTPWDVSSATYDSVELNVFDSSGASLAGFAVSQDGLNVYISTLTNEKIAQYTLTTAWDMSTGSLTATQTLTNMASTTTGLDISADGTKIYVLDYGNGNIDVFTMSTPYSIATASNTKASYSVPSFIDIRGISFSEDGLVIAISESSNGITKFGSLTTAFDLSTATWNATELNPSAQTGGTVYAIDIRNTDKAYYVSSSNDSVYEYDGGFLSNTLALGTGSFASADVGKTIEANDGAFVLTATSGSYVETTAPTSYAQVASGSWEMYGVVYNAVDGDLELSGVSGDSFNLAVAAYTSTTLQANQVVDAAFNNDGTKLFTLNQSEDVVEWSLSTPYLISSATYVTAFSVSSQDTGAGGLVFKSDGTKFYYVGTNTDTVYQYSLSTPWSIATASYDSVSFSVGSQLTAPYSIIFNTSGTTMMLVGGNNDTVYQYTLSTAWVVSSASYASLSLSVNSQDGTPTGIAFNADGSKLFMIGLNTDAVYQYSLPTSYSLSSASYDSVSFSVGSQATQPMAIVFTPTGSKFIVPCQLTNYIYEYSSQSFFTTTGYQPVHTTASTDTTYWTDINSMTADQAAGSGNVYYAISTDDRTTWTVIDNTDGERDIVKNNAGTWQYNSNGTYASETWVNGATNTELATLAEAMEGAAAGYNLANASYSSKSYSPPLGVFYADIAVKSDGTKFYVLHNGTPQALYQYSMSTPFDITTGSYDSVSFTLQDNNVNGLYFRDDGLKFYVVTGDADSVYSYSCSSAWDLSTASYDSVSFSVSSQESNPYDIAFKSDGTKMYMVGLTNDTVFQYTLSTAWDLSTASYDSVSFSVTSQESTPASIQFNNDGTEMYVLGFSSDSVHQYNLSTAWDLSTASYSTISFSVASQETAPRGFAFANSGANFYIVGDTTDVFQYAAPSYTNQMDKTQLDAVTDPNHIALGNDLDLAIVFNMTSGTTVPSSDGVAINYDANVLNKGAVLGTDYDFDAPTQNSVRITALAGNNLKVRVV